MRLTQQVLLLTLAAAGFATAQSDPPGRVGRLNYVSGTVSFQPGGVDDWVAASLNRPLTTGDHLWVDRESRAELHLGSSALRLSPRTSFQFLNLDDRTTQIRLSEGTLVVRLRHLDDDQVFEVDTPNLAFSLLRPGEYRVDANPDNETTTITVRYGEGEVTGAGQAFPVRPGEMARVTGNDSVNYETTSAPAPDYFEEWAISRDRLEDRSLSARYVSRDLIGYEDLDANGDWRQEAAYGNVWVPRHVPVGWAPYRFGHWAWIEPWGWTWVDDAPWGFAPFHYGRWAFLSGNWGWIPGPVAVRPVYAPALVAWVGGPRFNLSLSIGGGGGGVAWFPLGPREVYVPAYRASPTYINRVNTTNTTINNINVTNVYNNTNITNVRYVNQTAPNAVTAVSRDTFVGARNVGRAALPVQADALQNAPVVRSAAIAPNRESVLGRSANLNAVRPPDAVLNRAVVARATPPPARVPFMQTQQALQSNPGQPLDAAAISRIRASQPVAPRPLIRQTADMPANNGSRRITGPGGAPNSTTPAGNQPVYRGQPGTPNALPPVYRGQPGVQSPAPTTPGSSDVYRGRPRNLPDNAAPAATPSPVQSPANNPPPFNERRIQRPLQESAPPPPVRRPELSQPAPQPVVRPDRGEAGGSRRIDRTIDHAPPPAVERKAAPQAQDKKPDDKKPDEKKPDEKDGRRRP